LANKILHLQKNRNEVKRIGDTAIDFARNNFNKNIEAQSYMELYKNITNNS
jgi:glycosyltransferase involved in cell wall biosynthesis